MRASVVTPKRTSTNALASCARPSATTRTVCGPGVSPSMGFASGVEPAGFPSTKRSAPGTPGTSIWMAPTNRAGASSCTTASRSTSMSASCEPDTGCVARPSSCADRASMSLRSIMKASPSWLAVPMISCFAPALPAASAAQVIFASQSVSWWSWSATSLSLASLASGRLASSLCSVTCSAWTSSGGTPSGRSGKSATTGRVSREGGALPAARTSAASAASIARHPPTQASALQRKL